MGEALSSEASEDKRQYGCFRSGKIPPSDQPSPNTTSRRGALAKPILIIEEKAGDN